MLNTKYIYSAQLEEFTTEAEDLWVLLSNETTFDTVLSHDAFNKRVPVCFSWFQSINNGNKIGWSLSLVRALKKMGHPQSGSSICQSRVSLMTELDDKKLCYHLITIITISAKTHLFIERRTCNSSFWTLHSAITISFSFSISYFFFSSIFRKSPAPDGKLLLWFVKSILWLVDLFVYS